MNISTCRINFNPYMKKEKQRDREMEKNPLVEGKHTAMHRSSCGGRMCVVSVRVRQGHTAVGLQHLPS